MNTFQTNLLEGNIFNIVYDFTLTPVVRVTPGLRQLRIGMNEDSGS